jgi:TPR repeat protein
MKTILKTLFLFVSLTLAVPVFAQSDFEAVKASAEAGDAEAQYSLGADYAIGMHVEQNLLEAVRWFRLAANQGNVVAQWSLGVMYVNGSGVVQSNQRAYVWFSVAAATGHADARRNRDILSQRLTPQALEQAQAQATRCFESNFQDCD